MSIPYITNIQKYSIHDGDGIRTTIFFKGCALSCWWCHNPESQCYSKQLMFNKELCVGCDICSKVCDNNAISIVDNKCVTDSKKCTLCEKCLDYCNKSARVVAGKQYSVEEIVKLVEKDQMFYEQTGGGVTLSGGEIMSQDIDYLVKLCAKLKRKGFNITVDTCGYAPYSNFEKLMPFVDVFLYDIKLIDPIKHELYMGKDNVLILSNLKKISDLGAVIYIRIPVIGTVNSDDESIDDMINYIKENLVVKQVNLLPYHNTGSSKYDRLSMKYYGVNLVTPTENRMIEIAEKFKSNGFINTHIGG